MIIDTHCHIQFRGLDTEREAIIKRCRDKQIILNLIGTQKNTSRKAVELAKSRPDIYASIGTHPNHLFPTYIDEEENQFMSREEDFDDVYYEELYQSAPEKIIGVGETGLDLYHVPNDIPVETILKKQKEIFLKHLNFAKRHKLPLVIHVRDHVNPAALGVGAHDHLIELLQSLNRPTKGTVHCYTSDWAHAQKYLNLGLYLGFTGVVTFPPKKLDPQPQCNLLEVIEKMPLERILVETDAPFLAPQAYRGQRCEPWMTEEVVKKIAEVRGITYTQVETAVWENSSRLFEKIQLG